MSGRVCKALTEDVCSLQACVSSALPFTADSVGSAGLALPTVPLILTACESNAVECSRGPSPRQLAFCSFCACLQRLPPLKKRKGAVLLHFGLHFSLILTL